jgi:4-amino-4-deoxy-L-arabinose transferase-like glycosyltransferase
MLESGDFITPMLNYVKYFEKPPLHYWLNALSIRIFGETEFATRFPGALAGLLTVLFTYHVGQKLFGRREGLMAAIILGSSTGFLLQGRINLTDMTLTFCMTVSIGCFLLASRQNERNQGCYYYLFYLFAALAVLAKGLIGLLLPGGVIFLYMLICRRWTLLKEMRLLFGMPIFLVVAVPWFVVVSLRNPEFAQFFFIHEHFQRFLTKVHGRYEPVWFFIPTLLLTMLPWSFFVPQALVKAWQGRKEKGGDVLLFLFLWAVFIFLFFSKSNSKLIPYILPIFAPLALLVGHMFSRMLENEVVSNKTGMLIAAFLCILGCSIIAYPFVDTKSFSSPLGGFVVGSVFLLEGVLSFISVKRREMLQLFLFLSAGGLLVSLVAPQAVLSKISEKEACSRELCLMVRKVAGPETAVVSVGYEQGFPFYSHRRVVLAGKIGEFEFGSKTGNQSAWFMEEGGFPGLWDSGRHVVALVRPKYLEKLNTIVRTPVKVLGKDHRRVLVSNR